MLKSRVQRFERRLIVAALSSSGWCQRTAAHQLGVLPTTLNEKMKRLGIPLSAPQSGGGSEDPPPPAPGVLREEFRWSGRLPAGRTLEIVGVNGLLSVEAAPCDEVRVLAVKHSPIARHDEVVVKVLPSRRGVVLSVTGTASAPLPGETRVDARIQAPLGVRLLARMATGHLESFGIAGRFEVRAHEEMVASERGTGSNLTRMEPALGRAHPEFVRA